MQYLSRMIFKMGNIFPKCLVLRASTNDFKRYEEQVLLEERKSFDADNFTEVVIFSDRSALKCLNAENIESTNCEIADVQWCNNYIFHMLHVVSKVILENYFAFLICLKTKKCYFYSHNLQPHTCESFYRKECVLMCL